MILIGYVLEFIIIYFGYMLIVKKEIRAKVNDADRILRRSIKLIIEHRIIIKNNILLKVNYRKEKRKDIDIIKNSVRNLMLINGWGGFFFIMGPLIMSIWIRDKDNVLSIIFFCILAVSLLIKQLKEHAQCYIEVLERYIKQVIMPLEKYPKLIEIEDDEIISIQWTTKKRW